MCCNTGRLFLYDKDDNNYHHNKSEANYVLHHFTSFHRGVETAATVSPRIS